GFQVDDSMKERIVAEAGAPHPRAIIVELLVGPVGEVGPVLSFLVLEVCRVEIRGMAIDVDRFDPAQPSLHGGAPGPRPRTPAGQRKPYGLAKMIDVVGHARAPSRGDVGTTADSGPTVGRLGGRALELRVIEVGEGTAAAEQLGEAAVLDDGALAQHENQ